MHIAVWAGLDSDRWNPSDVVPSSLVELVAPYPSGKGEVCKTFMRRFESARRLDTVPLGKRSILDRFLKRRGGGIGRRTGLKILRAERSVPVQVRPSARGACESLLNLALVSITVPRENHRAVSSAG